MAFPEVGTLYIHSSVLLPEWWLLPAVWRQWGWWWLSCVIELNYFLVVLALNSNNTVTTCQFEDKEDANSSETRINHKEFIYTTEEWIYRVPTSGNSIDKSEISFCSSKKKGSHTIGQFRQKKRVAHDWWNSDSYILLLDIWQQ